MSCTLLAVVFAGLTSVSVVSVPRLTLWYIMLVCVWLSCWPLPVSLSCLLLDVLVAIPHLSLFLRLVLAWLCVIFDGSSPESLSCLLSVFTPVTDSYQPKVPTHVLPPFQTPYRRSDYAKHAIRTQKNIEAVSDDRCWVVKEIQNAATCARNATVARHIKKNHKKKYIEKRRF